MPYHGESEENRKEIWDDGLHFTPYGYNVMGDFIAQRMVELLPTVENPKNPRQSVPAEAK
jgi:lysophospholipase L1-like esterase